MKKRIFVILLTLLMVLTVAGCENNNAATPQNEQVSMQSVLQNESTTPAEETTPDLTEPTKESEPEITEPVLTEDITKPEVTEPVVTEPTKPTPTESKPTQPQPTEPAPIVPEPTEPVPTKPAPTEPKPTEPKPTEPKPTEPPVTEPLATEPPATEPAEVIDLNALVQYGRNYAANTYGYEVTPGLRDGYYPAYTCVISTMEEGRAAVRGCIDDTTRALLAVPGTQIVVEINGVLCRARIDIAIIPKDEGTYLISVYYG